MNNRQPAIALLLVGYTVAAIVLVRVRAVLRERRWRWFVALELATATVVVGYLLAGNRTGAVLNTLNLLVIAFVWVRTGRPGTGGSR